MSASATSSCPSVSTPEEPRAAPRWHVDRLEATDVRCWARVDLELPHGLVVVTGPNGAGKTSVVEAIALGLVGVSPRTSREREIVRTGAPALFVRLHVRGPAGATVRELGYSPGLGRRMRIDDLPARSVRAFRAHGSVLAFLPDEIRAVKGPPSARRRHLDRLLEGAIAGFADELAEYAAATGQRNALLRRIRAEEGGRDELGAWDAQVARLGAGIVRARRAALAAVSGPFADYLERLGGGPGGALALEPSPSVLRDTPDEDVEAVFAGRLQVMRERDVAAAQTLSGPHRDDVGVFAGGVDLRHLGSQGEQRTAALALVLAHRDHLARERARPVLLFDDALSELDVTRKERVLEALGEGGQAVVTSADAAAAASAVRRADAHIRVERGGVVRG